MLSGELFASDEVGATAVETLREGVALLRGCALGEVPAILAELRTILAEAPLRRMRTPGGRAMSVATTSCGTLGWVSDEAGYRYSAIEPASGRRWPAMPSAWSRLATAAAEMAGFPGFLADACLINRYRAGSRLSLHQDRHERDPAAPIVSLSLGLPAVFLFGGLRRGDPLARLTLTHGDVLVWGGPARFSHHGVEPLAPGRHPELGECRINLTFRKAG